MLVDGLYPRQWDCSTIMSVGDCSGKMMLLWMSSCSGDLLVRSPEGCEDLASNVAFETTDDLGLAHSLSGTSAHIFPGPAVMAKPDHNDAIESCIGLAVATPVEPVPVGLARGSRYRVHSAQRGEGSL